jgi:triacylglycerol esterase/lipase EstA (alpha/beta hydrolase family)
LARRLLLALAVELGVYAAVGVWLVRSQTWSAASALVLGVAIAVGWRIVLGLVTYLIAWRHRSATPPGFRLSGSALVPHVIRELGAMAAVYFVLQPFERIAMGHPAPPHGRSGRIPVLLVHGYVCNRASGWALARGLRRRGETVWAVTLEPVYGTIDAWIEPLAAAIDALRVSTGAERVIVVTHSMGGLATRAYLRAHPGAKLAALITLGAPHHGSEHARIGLGQSAREMEPGSAWLAALAAADAQGAGVPFVSIFSHHDNLVAPQRSSVHPAARNVPLAGIGHLTLLFSARVRELVENELDSLNGIGAVPPAPRRTRAEH